MSKVAVGAYFLRLREEARLSRLALARQIGTGDAQLLRIENGEQETRGSLIAALTHALDASPQDVLELYLLPNDTLEDGRKRAEQLIASRLRPGRSEVHPDVLHLVEQMTEYELGRWVALGERMVEARRR